MSLITGICLSFYIGTNSLAGGQGHLPTDSFKEFHPGTGCNENPFSGNVVDDILAATKGMDADGLEIHYRKGKDKPWKAKRVYVSARDRMAYPVQKKNGGCVRIWTKYPFTTAQLNQLLTTKESLLPLTKSDSANNSPGVNFTVGTYLIIKN